MSAIETPPLDLAAFIRNVPDFPKPGIQFKDITTLLNHPEAFRAAVERLAAATDPTAFDAVAGIDARGFIFGGAVAYRLGKGFIPLRKRGKLPYKTVEVEYALEYGTDAVAAHEDALACGSRVVLVDDVIATGGTLQAAARLIERLGGTVVAVLALAELTFLNPREKLRGWTIHSLIQY